MVACAPRPQALVARGRGSVGRASPCQGEGRGFESRRPLGVGLVPAAARPVLTGGVAERRGNGLQIRAHGFESRLHLGRLAQLVARFPDTEEVISSSLVPPTSNDSRSDQAGNRHVRAGRMNRSATRLGRPPIGRRPKEALIYSLVELVETRAATVSTSSTSGSRHDQHLPRTAGRGGRSTGAEG